MTSKRNGTLVIGTSWVGDAVMSSSFIQALAKLYHDPIDLVAPALSAPIGKLMPEVSTVFTTDFAHGEIGLGKRRRLARELKARSYARAYVLPNNLKAALVPWLAGIPERHGWRGEWRFGIVNRIRLHRHLPADRHEARFMAALAHPAGEDFELLLPSLRYDPNLQTKVCAAHGIEREKSYVALAVGAAKHDSGKLWPTGNYAQIANELSQDGHRIVFCGSKEDSAIAEKILKLVSSQGVINLCGRVSLEETASILAMCSGVISNDSGLMHLGAALGRPTLGIFGPTDPRRYHPLGNHADYLAPEQPGPIEQIEIGVILAKAREMLGSN